MPSKTLYVAYYDSGAFTSCKCSDRSDKLAVSLTGSQTVYLHMYVCTYQKYQSRYILRIQLRKCLVYENSFKNSILKSCLGPIICFFPLW
jgi:hypothetical protein